MSSSGIGSSGSLGSDPVMNTRILIIALVILATVVLILVSMHFYARWVWVSSRHSQWDWRWRENTPPATLQAEAGLDKRILDALPTFVYSKENTKEAMECSVCISEFQENETARLLPKCNHCFHTACIDLWLQSHSTCPLCRTKLDEESVSEDQVHNLRVEVDEEMFPRAAASSHEQSDDQQVNVTIEMGSDVADTSSVQAELSSRGERLKNLDHHLVVDVPSRAAINPFDSTPGSTPRPSASSHDQSRTSPLSHLRRMLTTRERRSAIPASPKSTAVDEATP